MTSRDRILNKLRAASRPFPDAPPRPRQYLPVNLIADNASPAALLERFGAELDRLKGQMFAVPDDAAARACILDLLRQHETTRLLAWDFQHIPLEGIEAEIRAAEIEIIQPNTHDEFRAETLAHAETAQMSLTGVDAAIAATGTLVFTTAPGKGRIPTVLAPAHIAVIRQHQLLPRLEDWMQTRRAAGLETLRHSANFCFVTGPSRTGDIEMELILGVHGPGKLYAVVVQA